MANIGFFLKENIWHVRDFKGSGSLKLNFTGIFAYAEKRNCFQWALEWHIGISQGVCGTGGWTTLSLSQWEVLRDEFEGFLGGSLKSFGAPWEHIWAQPEKVWLWKQLRHLSVALLGWSTDPSFHEWLFSTAAASFLSLCLHSPLIQMPHTPSLSIVPAQQYHLS